MRYIILKKHSTKAERRFYEILKEMRILFKFREKVAGYEVDFLVGEYAIEIDGHAQSTQKNVDLINAGYVPVHYDNVEFLTPEGIEQIKQTITHGSN